MHASGFAWNLFGCPFRSLVSDFSSTIVTNSTTGHLQIKCSITLQEFYTCIILGLGSSRSDAFNIIYSGSNFSAYSPSTQNTTPYHFVCSLIGWMSQNNYLITHWTGVSAVHARIQYHDQFGPFKYPEMSVSATTEDTGAMPSLSRTNTAKVLRCFYSK